MSVIALDPLIAEAKARAVRRRLLGVTVAVLIAVATAFTLFSLRPARTVSNNDVGSYRQANVDSFGRGGGVAWAFSWVGTSRMKLWLTPDDGQTWRSVRLPGRIDAVDIDQIQFTDRRHGWFVADDPPGSFPRNDYGQVFRTVDGGRSWSRSVAPGCRPGCGFASISFRTPQRGYLLDGPPEGRGRLYVTADGGATWRLLSRPSLPYGQIFFLNRRVGVAETGRTVQGGRLARTHNGGRTWTPVPLALGDLTTASGGLGDMPWIRGADLIVGTVRYLHGGRQRRLVVNVSSDRGATWHRRATPWLFADDPTFEVATPRRWIVAGDAHRGRVYVTTDAGRSWSWLKGSLERAELRLRGTRDAWAVHGTTLVRTIDGGLHWTPAGPRIPKAHKRG
jgi:photosystem II stability/assembly factor-like uncharacterized protein